MSKTQPEQQVLIALTGIDHFGVFGACGAVMTQMMPVTSMMALHAVVMSTYGNMSEVDATILALMLAGF